MASIANARSALDALENSVNALLLQTGSFLGDPANFDNRHLFRSSTTLKHHVPVAVETVQEALGTLEYELVIAKCALLRDLEIYRKEQATPKSQTPTAATLQQAEAAPDMNEKDALISPVEIEETADTDVVMVDSPQTAREQSPDQKPNTPPAHPDQATETASPHSDKSQPKPSEEDAILTEKAGEATIDANEDNVVHIDSSGDDEASRDNSLHIDFGTVPQSRSAKRASVGSSAAEKPNLAQSGAGSLLPGLEIYANDEGMDAFGDITDMDNFAATNTFREAGLVDGNGGTMNIGREGEYGASGEGDGSTFDDLFDFGDFGGTDGNEATQAPMTFDDSQFGADFFDI